MVKDLVSVIIPCYNHEEFIERCLNSILNDSYPHKEIIIIDDGSKDKSVDVIRNFIRENKNSGVDIRFYSQENSGVVKTLNRLVDLANGEFIAVVASDDELFNNGIEKRVSFLKGSDYKAVIGNASVVDFEGKILRKYAASQFFHASLRNLRNTKKFYRELIMQWCVVGPCLLLRKEVYDTIGKYNEEYTIEDRDFYLRLIENNLLGYVEDVVALYRVHGLNMSLNNATKKVRIQCAAINIFHAALQNKKMYKYFLQSYKIDKRLLENNRNFSYFLFKLLRFIVVKVIRLF